MILYLLTCHFSSSAVDEFDVIPVRIPLDIHWNVQLVIFYPLEIACVPYEIVIHAFQMLRAQCIVFFLKGMTDRKLCGPNTSSTMLARLSCCYYLENPCG